MLRYGCKEADAFWQLPLQRPTEMDRMLIRMEASFIDRDHCINCNSTRLTLLSSGRFGDEPLKSFIVNDPWGKSPMPYIQNKTWGFVQCAKCGQKFHRYVLSPEWNEIRFSQWMSQDAIEAFEAQIQTPMSRFEKSIEHVQHVLRLEKMTRGIRGEDPIRILDFGCGWGDFLATADRFGFIGYGIDRSSGRRNLGQHASIFADIDELMEEVGTDISFHAISLFEVLEHLDEPLAVLRTLSHLIVPGGVLILETPDCENVNDIVDLDSYRKIHPLDHINAFTAETLTSIARRAGFVPLKRPASYVTMDISNIAKTGIKQLLPRLQSVGTQKYFRKL